MVQWCGGAEVQADLGDELHLVEHVEDAVEELVGVLEPVDERLKAIQRLHLLLLHRVQDRLQHPGHPGQLGLVQGHHRVQALQAGLGEKAC